MLSIHRFTADEYVPMQEQEPDIEMKDATPCLIAR